MKLMHFVCLTMSISTIFGCAVVTDELDTRLVGSTEHYFRDFGSKTFRNPNYYESDNDSCLKEGEQFDIRMDTQVFYEAFEGGLENFSEGAFWGINSDSHDTNEIGVFLSVESLDRSLEADTNSIRGLELEKSNISDRLIYSSFPRKKGHPLNQKNKLVYSGIASKNDLRFIIEVREFDKSNGAGVTELIGLLSEEASKYTQAANPLIGSVLDKLGTAVKTGMFRDDLIASFDMEFVPCGVYGGSEQVYLREGQHLFLRHSQSSGASFQRQQDLSWDTEKGKLSNNSDSRSYTTFNVYRRVNSKVFTK